MNEGIILKGFGLCAAGFFFLAGWCWIMWGKVNKNEITKENFDEVLHSLKNIEGALAGTLEKPRGLLALMEDHWKEIQEIKDNCKKVQDDKRQMMK